MHLQYITPLAVDALVAQDATAYCYAVARAVASVLPVPAAPVESASVFFDETHEEIAEKIVGTFNEARPLDFNKTLATAKSLWMVRYGTLHDAADDAIIEGLSVAPTLFDFFGATAFVSNEDRDYLVENHKEVLKTVGMCIKAARKMHAGFVAGA